MLLRDCPEGFRGRIKMLKGPSVLRKRLLALGFVPGREVRVVRNAPLKDPLEVEVLDGLIAIRRDEAAYIAVEI